MTERGKVVTRGKTASNIINFMCGYSTKHGDEHIRAIICVTDRTRNDDRGRETWGWMMDGGTQGNCMRCFVQEYWKQQQQPPMVHV
jgi:hypothetical protein